MNQQLAKNKSQTKQGPSADPWVKIYFKKQKNRNIQ